MINPQHFIHTTKERAEKKINSKSGKGVKERCFMMTKKIFILLGL